MKRSLSKRQIVLLAIVPVLAIGILLWWKFYRPDPPKPPDSATMKAVRFGMLPYGDHTYAIIGAKKGWFNEVGIDLQYQSIKVDDIVPYLKNSTQDVISCPPGVLMSAYDNAPNLKSFVFGDLFQGYAIMAQPDAGYKSYAEFVAEGMTPDQAIKATVQQMMGKTFAFPTETAIKPFIDLVFEKGGIKLKEVQPLVTDDPQTINAMRIKRAQFQVGGVPSRLTLQKEGFKPIISSIDLVKDAKPSESSKELSSILQNGWATTKEYYEKEHDTILRLASVNYRIMKFINTNEQEALSIHMPYLSEVSGQQFTVEDGKIIYESLNPFITFENQRSWFHDSNNPLYYKYVNGSLLKSYIDQGIFKGPQPTLDDIIVADDVYFELEKLKEETEGFFQKIEDKKVISQKPNLAGKYERAKNFYQVYNFLDSRQIAKEILDEADVN